MKKILLITRPITPPWDEASKNFAYFLAKTTPGFEFHVLTPGHVDALEPHIKQEQIYTSAHLDWSQRLRLFKLAPMIKNFDIAHFMLTPNKLNTWAFKTFLTSKTTKTIQTIATLREDLFTDSDFKKIIFADLVITYSDYAKKKLQKIGSSNVVRIYPGIDTNLYSPANKNFAAMRMLEISQGDFIVSYPGEYTRLGATDDLVEMLPTLFERLPKAKFIFACRVKNEKDAVKKDAVMKALKEKGISNKVIFTDTFSDMPKLYNISDVVLFPVRNMEGKFDVPLAVIEAFACAKPVIVSNLPILQEFTSPENSIVINPENKNELLEAIIDLHGDKEKCRSIGDSARRYAVENFDIKDVAEQYEKAYTRLLS
jgi:glycosyltransferase involved in cell wall biosynthesis